ncbi:inositol monophosphatase family protein [Tropicimonas sp.]|uniref:inositol monophosphatase family protein n=1 Tax=Tropicimonas sp. TaxID=2067044 RepID=UPI003A8A0AF3
MIPTLQQESDLIEAVRSAARTEILPRFRNLGADAVAEKTNADDLVTIGDRASEASIAAAVRRILPGAEVVGEEAVSENPEILGRIAGADTCVIIDPIDGTWNFAKGLALFGVLLAVTHRGETVFGLLYDPVLDDWVLSRRGGGTWFCDPAGRRDRLDVRDGGEPTGFAGFASPWLLPEHQRARFATGVLDYGRVRDLGCACHDYRMLCFGVGRFGFAMKLMPWDHAAGVLAYSEAGGHVGMLDGRSYAPTLHQGIMISARDADTLADLRAKFAWLRGE